MSQQPPYGPPDPQQPPQQGYTPYSQGAYPNPYAGFPQQPKSNTTRNVLLIVGAVVLLFCGGIIAFFAWAVNNVDDAFETDFEGSEEKPLTVTEGEPFSIRGFDYERDWSIVSDPDGDLVIEGVRGTNMRDDKDAESVYVVFKFYRDNEQLASVNCTGGGSIAYERSVTLRCSSYGEDVTGYDEIEVFDSSFSE